MRRTEAKYIQKVLQRNKYKHIRNNTAYESQYTDKHIWKDIT